LKLSGEFPILTDMRLNKRTLLLAGTISFFLGTSDLFSAEPNSPPTLPPSIPQAAAPAPAVVNASPIPVPNLVWDAEMKTYNAQPGEATANFTFNLTNVAPIEIIINSVQTSCGCTVAKLPSQPWHLASGSNGQIQVSVNLAGKMGTVVKQVTANTSVGMKQVSVTVIIPPPTSQAGMSQEDRNRNLSLAAADRQAVFKNDCASCHVKPALGKMGADLYVAACGICHESPHRASQVPDLHALQYPTNQDYWRHWIRNGRGGSMMPAFEIAQGGPLNPEQINSLSDYLEKAMSHAVGAAPAITNAAFTAPNQGQRVFTVPPAGK
jgi:cytochrome c553